MAKNKTGIQLSSAFDLGGFNMFSIDHTLRLAAIGLLLASGVAHAAPADQIADLSVGITGSSSALVFGGTKNYTVTLANAGPNYAEGVTLTAVVPAGMEIAAVDGCKPTSAPDPVTLEVAPFPCAVVAAIPYGEAAAVVVTVSVPFPDPLPTTCPAPDSIGAFQATVATASTDPDLANNTGSITRTVGKFSDIQLTFSGPATAVQGQTVDYVVTVTNAGPCAADRVRAVSGNFSGGLIYTGATGPCAAVADDDPCILGAMAPAAVITYTKSYLVADMPPDLLSNANPNGLTVASTATAAVAANPTANPPVVGSPAIPATPDPDTDNNTKSSTTLVTQAASGCSSSGAGGPLGLLVVGAALVLGLRRRRLS